MSESTASTHAIESHVRGLSDADLRRLYATGQDTLVEAAIAIARDELARRGIPPRSAAEYWRDCRDEWFETIGFCLECWSTTTEGEPDPRSFQTAFDPDGEPCPDCDSVPVVQTLRVLFIPLRVVGRFRVARLDRGVLVWRKRRE